MCRKKNKTPLYKPSVDKPDVQALKQELRIKLWNMIAQNNGEDWKDPRAKVLENAMPYVQNAETTAPMGDDIAKIKPTLDEVLPLPEQKPDKPKTAKKKRASELIAGESASSEGEQMTIDDAVSDAEGNPPRKPETQSSEQIQSTSQESATPEQNQQSANCESTESAPTKRTVADVLQSIFDWRRERAERKDYFTALDLQIENKNSVCYELLKFLDEI